MYLDTVRQVRLNKRAYGTGLASPYGQGHGQSQTVNE